MILTKKNVNFKVGDEVMVYFPVTKVGLSTKLLPLWQGPYVIKKQLGDVTYRVEKEEKLISVHVQRLLPYTRFNKDS